MRPEANLRRRGGRSSPGFSGPLASSGSLVAPLHRWRGERRNHIRHHQPPKLTVRESGAGPGCGLVDVRGTDEADKERLIRWGSRHVQPLDHPEHSWFSEFDGGDALSEAFPGFWKLFVDRDWNPSLRRTIDCYVQSNSSPITTGVVLAQAALESLGFRVDHEKGGGKSPSKKWKFVKGLKKALRALDLGVDDQIPSRLGSLGAVAAREGWSDGPMAIAKIRNDLVHGERYFAEIPFEAQWDAWRLGCWYIELILLRRIGFVGRYSSRLARPGESPFKRVPWVGDGEDAEH